MTINRLTDERLAQIHAECEECDPGIVEIRAVIEELQERRKAQDELEAAERRNERALSPLGDANTENVWEIIGRLKVVISGDYRSEAEIASAAAKGE